VDRLLRFVLKGCPYLETNASWPDCGNNSSLDIVPVSGSALCQGSHIILKFIIVQKASDGVTLGNKGSVTLLRYPPTWEFGFGVDNAKIVQILVGIVTVFRLLLHNTNK
jgi:hypothetical protein